MKLGLGTVQLGLNYGISNRAGRTPIEEAAKIIEQAGRAGVTIIDTATAYGTSEETIGAVLSKAEVDFRIVTKLPKLTSSTFDIATFVSATFKLSLEKLQQSKVYALLVHSAEDLLSFSGDELYSSMRKLKRSGLVEKIGVSIYSGDQIDRLMELYDLDLIQLPFNVFDQRMLLSGHMERLRRRGIEIHSRSVFLQGLLLMHTSDLPAHFAPYRPHIIAYREFLERAELTAVEAALSFAIMEPNIDTVLCGVNDVRQLNGLLSVLAKPLPRKLLDPLSAFASSEMGLINPSLWKND